MEVVRFWDGQRYTTGLAREGRKLVRMVTITDHGVAVIALPLVSGRGFEPLRYKNGLYPVPRAKRLLREAGQRLGITKQARAILRDLA